MDIKKGNWVTFVHSINAKNTKPIIAQVLGVELEKDLIVVDNGKEVYWIRPQQVITIQGIPVNGQ